MFKFIKHVFIALLSFSGSLATKCVSLSEEPCVIRSIPIVLNPFELHYNLFMISLDKCSGSCYSVDDLSTKVCVLSKTKDINIKIFNII